MSEAQSHELTDVPVDNDGLAPSSMARLIEAVTRYRVADREFETQAEAEAYLTKNALEAKVRAWVDARYPENEQKSKTRYVNLILEWETTRKATIRS